MGMVHPTIMLALERGSACWNINHWAEMNNFCLTEMSLLQGEKTSPLATSVWARCQACAGPSTVRIQAVLCFSETHEGLGASSGTCSAFWAPLCLPFSMWWLNLPCSPTLLFLSHLSQRQHFICRLCLAQEGSGWPGTLYLFFLGHPEWKKSA